MDHFNVWRFLLNSQIIILFECQKKGETRAQQLFFHLMWFFSLEDITYLSHQQLHIQQWKNVDTYWYLSFLNSRKSKSTDWKLQNHASALLQNFIFTTRLFIDQKDRLLIMASLNKAHPQYALLASVSLIILIPHWESTSMELAVYSCQFIILTGWIILFLTVDLRTFAIIFLFEQPILQWLTVSKRCNLNRRWSAMSCLFPRLYLFS